MAKAKVVKGCERHGLPDCPVCPARPKPPSGAEKLGRVLGVLLIGIGTFIVNVISDLAVWGIYCATFGSIAYVALWGMGVPVAFWSCFGGAALLRVGVFAVKHAWMYDGRKKSE